MRESPLLYAALSLVVVASACQGRPDAVPGDVTAQVALTNVETQLNGLVAKLDEVGKKQEDLARRLEALENGARSGPAEATPEPEPEDEAAPALKDPGFKLELFEPVPTKSPNKAKSGGSVGNGAGSAAASAKGAAGAGASLGAAGAVAGSSGKAGAGEGASGVELLPGEFDLVNIKLAASVDRKLRQPTNAGDKFKLSDKTVYCWLVFSNKSDKKVPIDLVWKKEGKKTTSIVLEVGPKASHWRTWSHILVSEKSLGQWTVDVIGPNRESLATRSFSVVP